MSIRSMAAFEGHFDEYPFRVYAPTETEFDKIQDGYTHGETAFTDCFPNLKGDDIFNIKNQRSSPARSPNFMNEWLAGNNIGQRDLKYLQAYNGEQNDLPRETFDGLAVSEKGCWEKVQETRYDAELERTILFEAIGMNSPDQDMFQLCLNDACICPRHCAIGTPEQIGALKARVEILERYNLYRSKQWARPSFAYPNGVEHLVDDEVNVLTNRSAMLLVAMSKKEYLACIRTLSGRTTLPSGGWTTDPGYHVLFGAMKQGLDFDNATGCWNARINLDVLPPHKQTITHACGSMQCCNPRHMDITESHSKFYELPMDKYATQSDGGVVVKASGEVLPSYWRSWELYWNWLREYSIGESAETPALLSVIDFGHIWVHPLTGCWENESFYPRWTKGGAQQNAYGFHRSTYGEFGRSTHRYLYYKYQKFLGETV